MGKCLGLIRLGLSDVAVFPVIAGLRKGIVTLGGLGSWHGFLGLSFLFVQCFLGNGWFIHNHVLHAVCGIVMGELFLGGLARFRE